MYKLKNKNTMKNLIFIIALFFVSCSEKTEVVTPEKCVTCTETTYYQQSGQIGQTYISFQETYCNGIPSTVVQGTLSENGTMNSIAWKRTKTMVCK